MNNEDLTPYLSQAVATFPRPWGMVLDWLTEDPAPPVGARLEMMLTVGPALSERELVEVRQVILNQLMGRVWTPGRVDTLQCPNCGKLLQRDARWNAHDTEAARVTLAMRCCSAIWWISVPHGEPQEWCDLAPGDLVDGFLGRASQITLDGVETICTIACIGPTGYVLRLVAAAPTDAPIDRASIPHLMDRERGQPVAPMGNRLYTRIEGNVQGRIPATVARVLGVGPWRRACWFNRADAQELCEKLEAIAACAPDAAPELRAWAERTVASVRAILEHVPVEPT